MEVISALGNYFLSVWLWSITYGGYHIPFAIVYMLLILKFFVRMGWAQSVLVSLGTNLYAWLTYTALALGALYVIMSFEYIPETPHANVCERTMLICGSLALVYTFLQAVLFAVINMGQVLNWPRAVMLCLIVNMLAALSVYTLLPIYC